MSIRWDTRNKRWRFEFDRYLQGQRHRASRLLPAGWSQAQADAYDRTEGARLYAVAAGLEQADPLIDAAVALYLQDKTGLKSYKSAAEHLAAIAWAYVGKPMSALPEVARTVAANPVGAREGVTLQPATVRNRLAVLKAACRWAWRAHGLVKQDPTTRMQLPAVRNARHVYATRQQVGQLVRHADRRDLRVVILLAFYTGMRLGEVLRAKPRDQTLILDDTKNGDRRQIPVHPRARRLLKHLPITTPRITLQRAFQRARVRAGVPHIHLHDLRHSAASEMINAGVGLYTVGAVLGHRDARSTQRYAHLTHQSLADAVGKIGQKAPHKAPARGKKKAARKAA
jgi:integrase